MWYFITGDIMNQLVESNIENLIYEIREKQVMLDSDLAKLFNYSTKDLNRNVKNNLERFPTNYCFQLTLEKVNILSSRSQNFTLNKSGNLRGYNLKYLPYVFTEHGVVTMAGILKSDIAVKNNLKNFLERFSLILSNYESNQLLVKNFDPKIETRGGRYKIIYLNKLY